MYSIHLVSERTAANWRKILLQSIMELETVRLEHPFVVVCLFPKSWCMSFPALERSLLSLFSASWLTSSLCTAVAVDYNGPESGQQIPSRYEWQGDVVPWLPAIRDELLLQRTGRNPWESSPVQEDIDHAWMAKLNLCACKKRSFLFPRELGFPSMHGNRLFSWEKKKWPVHPWW